MEILIPSRCIVLICGPTCGGKSTLAERIHAEAPWSSKAIHSSDRALDEIYAKRPELIPYHAYCSAVTPGKVEMPPFLKQMQKDISLLLTEMVESALRQYDLLIMEEIRLQPELLLFNLQMLGRMSNNRPVVLIKMLVNDDLCETFYRSRRNDRQPPLYLVNEQRREFRNIMQYDFSKVCTHLSEYNMTNPQEATLKFI